MKEKKEHFKNSEDGTKGIVYRKTIEEADKEIKTLNKFDHELLSDEQIEQLNLLIEDYENGNTPAVNLIQHWSSLPSKLDCGRFPEITKYLDPS